MKFGADLIDLQELPVPRSCPRYFWPLLAISYLYSLCINHFDSTILFDIESTNSSPFEPLIFDRNWESFATFRGPNTIFSLPPATFAQFTTWSLTPKLPAVPSSSPHARVDTITYLRLTHPSPTRRAIGDSVFEISSLKLIKPSSTPSHIQAWIHCPDQFYCSFWIIHH